MAASVEQLEKRLTVLEQEVALMRQLVLNSAADKRVPVQKGAHWPGKADQAAISAAIAKAFAKMGITGEPVGAEKLRDMMLACGVDPAKNEFSREIIAMRDE